MKTNIGLIIAISLIFGSCNEEVLENNAKLELNSLVALSSTGIEFNAVVTEIPAGNVTEYGICYSSETDAPTVENSKVVLANVALNQEIKGIINGLKKNTKYYVRFYLVQNDKAVYSRTKNATTFEEPKLVTDIAYAITYTSATLTGNAIANNIDTELFFEYGETSGYGLSIKANPEKITGVEKIDVKADLTSLKPNTNYHYRLKGVCNYATVYGEDRIFSTKQAEIPNITTESIQEVGRYDAICNGNIVSTSGIEILEVGFCLSTAENPTIESTKITAIVTETNFNAKVSGLIPNTKYFVRAFAINNVGIAYGNQLEFTTLAIPQAIAITENASNITYTGAILHATVNAKGENTRISFEYGTNTNFGDIVNAVPGTLNGTELTMVSAELNNLTAGTSYLFRVKAENEGGIVIGNTISFATKALGLPELTTLDISQITISEAQSGGSISTDGGSIITERGICWSMQPLPTIFSEKTVQGSGLGEFTCALSNLSPNATYFVRAFATNSIGTAYGNQIIFTTLPAPTPNYSGEIILINGGTFEMGCNAIHSPCQTNELPAHSVTLSNFYIGKYEVTNQEFADFLNAYGQSTVKAGETSGEKMVVENSVGGIIKTENGWAAALGKENYPAIDITWFGASEFCAFYGGRLPTEAEWEFAAKGGIHATDEYIYSGSNQVELVAIYAGNSTNTANNLETGMGTFTIGSLAANQLTIFDLSGNVNEWVSDWYADYTINSQIKPLARFASTQKLYRGGSWKDAATGLKVTSRYPALPNLNGNNIGFRFAKSISITSK